MMQTQAATEEFEDLPYHQSMWHAFMRFTVRGIIAIIVILLFLGFITGLL